MGARRVFRALLLVGVFALLWPATWGGLTEFTIVNGNSMEPVYGTNDLVLTVQQTSYEVGDVISCEVPAGQDGAGRRVIRRIIAVDDTGEKPVFTTQGDNNPSVDPWKVKNEEILGEAKLYVPRIGAVVGGSSGLMLGIVAGFAALVVFWPSRPPASRSALRRMVIR